MSNPEDIRNKAAQIKKTADSAAKRKSNIAQIVGGSLVAVVVVGIIGVGLFAKSNAKTDSLPPELATEYNSSAQLPAGVSAKEGYGVPVGTSNANVPRVELYEDFQCPACGQLEKVNSENILAAGEKDEINLTLHPMIFLDRNFPESKRSSLRSTMAWGCAVDAGKTVEYHSGVFEMQPAQEGKGFTDDQLINLAKKVGITDAALTDFEDCFSSAKYQAWAENSQLHAQDRGVPGTPAMYINDAVVDSNTIYDKDLFAQAVAAAK